MISNEEKEVAKKIGEFYLQKTGDYEKAAEEIIKLQITHLEIKNSKVFLSTGRPGRLIGVRGENIKALCMFIGYGIHIIEDELIDTMIPLTQIKSGISNIISRSQRS